VKVRAAGFLVNRDLTVTAAYNAFVSVHRCLTKSLIAQLSDELARSLLGALASGLQKAADHANGAPMFTLKSFAAAPRAALLVAALCLAAPAANANLIVNGSFENPDLQTRPCGFADWCVFQTMQGWSRVSGSGIEVQRNGAVGGVATSWGRQYVELDSDNERGGLQNQSKNSGMASDLFTLNENWTYTLSFQYRPRTNVANDNGIEAYLSDWGGTNAFSRLLVTANEAGGGWRLITVSNIAVQTAGNYRLAFRAIGIANEYGGFIDDVSLTGKAPEPATLALLGAGALGMAALRRRKA
jgi:hypothetical protein